MPPRATVLVVEDELAVAEVMLDILRFAGYDPIHLTDGQSAVEHVEQAPPDLILLDLMLPVLDGVAASQQLKHSANPAVARVPIVAMSAGVNLREASPSLAVDGVLGKPFEVDELLATVQLYVHGHGSA